MKLEIIHCENGVLIKHDDRKLVFTSAELLGEYLMKNPDEVKPIRYDVFMQGWANMGQENDKRILCIKLMRERFGWSLVDSKGKTDEILISGGCTLAENVSIEEAKTIKAHMEQQGSGAIISYVRTLTN